jgi:hypothetical protein
MKKAFLSFLFILHLTFVFSQGEIDDENKILFRNEKSYGVSLNTNGYGIGYRFARHINIHKKFSVEGDVNIVKHSKEKKITNPLTYNIFNYVYGKTNYAFNIRLSAGMQHELYRKFDRNSVSVRLFYSGGLSAMFLKPIYYDVWDDSLNTTKTQLFEKNTPWWFIYDKKPFTKGFNEIKIIPGIYVKTGVSFEFGKTDKKLSVLETGISFEAYPKDIKIMETEYNPRFLPILFLSYRFGKVVSNYYLKDADENRN